MTTTFSLRMDSSKRACQSRERVFPPRRQAARLSTTATLAECGGPRGGDGTPPKHRLVGQANHNRLIRFKLIPDRYLDARIAKNENAEICSGGI